MKSGKWLKIVGGSLLGALVLVGCKKSDPKPDEPAKEAKATKCKECGMENCTMDHSK